MNDVRADVTHAAELRDEAREHIRDHTLKEAAESSGSRACTAPQTDRLVPLGVVTGMAAANPGRCAILVAGIAEAVAGCIAMGRGS
jgi:hypothetical protein